MTLCAACDTFTPTPVPAKANLVITDLAVGLPDGPGLPECVPTPVHVSDWGTHVIVSNIGAGNAGPFTLRLDIQEQEVQGLASGDTIAVWFNYCSCFGSATATADVYDTVHESSEDDNHRSETGTLCCPVTYPTCTPES